MKYSESGSGMKKYLTLGLVTALSLTGCATRPDSTERLLIRMSDMDHRRAHYQCDSDHAGRHGIDLFSLDRQELNEYRRYGSNHSHPRRSFRKW